MSTKVCNGCKRELPASAFYPKTRRNGRAGLRARCKDCERAYELATRDRRREWEKNWRAKNPEKSRATGRRYAERHPDRVKAASARYQESHREERNQRAIEKRAADPLAREKERAREAARRGEIRANKAARYEKKRESMLAKAATWRGRSREKISNYNRAHYQSNKQAYKARAAVRKAIAAGTLVRPAKCERCPSEAKLFGHHHSYAKEHWLDVEWLCKRCHQRHHAAEDAA